MARILGCPPKGMDFDSSNTHRKKTNNYRLQAGGKTNSQTRCSLQELSLQCLIGIWTWLLDIWIWTSQNVRHLSFLWHVGTRQEVWEHVRYPDVICMPHSKLQSAVQGNDTVPPYMVATARPALHYSDVMFFFSNRSTRPFKSYHIRRVFRRQRRNWGAKAPVTR